MHKAALADFALARARTTAANKLSPPWSNLLEAYANADLTRIIVEQGPLSPLAALLRLMAVEYPVMTDLTLLAAKDVLALAPDCFRVYDSMCRVSGVSNLHEATTIGPAALDRTLMPKLSAVEKLPAVVKKPLEGPDVREVAIRKLLAKAAVPAIDSGEPSWAALALLIRETRFVQVAWRLHFMAEIWHVPNDKEWEASAESVADHPYVPYLESLVYDAKRGPDAMDKLVTCIDLASIEFSALRMLLSLANSKRPGGQMPLNLARKHHDAIARDISALMPRANAQGKVVHANSLLEISPKSPLARATLIELDWESAKPHMVEWEADAKKSPAILAALARRYSGLAQYDDAEKVLRRYLAFSPDQWAYELLAKNYKSRSDLQHWQSTLEEFLAKTEDHGLSHATVNVELAHHFMDQKQWDRARPYAEAAAQSGTAGR